MEINQRMSKRFAWMLGVAMLVSIGLLVACGSNYNASSDGLMLVGSQGSGLVETFSFNLGSGHVSAISNTPNDTSSLTCVLNGIPSSLVVDPAGAYAYTIINANSLCTTDPTKPSTTGILAFKVGSDGTTTQVGNLVLFNQGIVTPCLPFLPPAKGCQPSTSTEQVPVLPSMMVMDPAGKFLFVADRATTDSTGLFVPGAVSVFAIGSGGTVTEVAGSPFFTSNNPMTLPQSGLDIVSVAPTPTVLPLVGINGVRNAVCNDLGNNPATLQYLYAVDGLGNQVFEFSVDTTSGVLKNPATLGQQPFPTDQIPAGVAVDPCNRFVYVSDSLTNRVSAYAICNGSTTSPAIPCAALVPGALVEVAGSPFGLSGSANSPGPLVVDAFGNYVYVVGTLSNTVSVLKISPITGSLTATAPATVATGVGPKAIAIRADDSWMFVSNFGSSSLGGNTVTQYLVTPQSGALTVQPPIQTDNYPWGVAVK
jgi:DNA-binding beta-propeller fold protein YncE